MPNLTKSELADLKDQINTFHHKGIEAAKWGIVYFINAGEGLQAVREALEPRTFKPWLEKNFEGSRNTAYKYIKLAEGKDRIKELSVTHGLQIESMRKAFAVLGAYYEVESTTPITAIQTPESPRTDDALPVPSSAPEVLANAPGGSPAPSEAERAIDDRLLKPGEKASFESGLGGEFQEQYLCFGDCGNFFYAEELRTLGGNRFCRNCREQLPDEPPGDLSDHPEPIYDHTLFDEALPEPNAMPLPCATTLPETNGTEPPAMTERDPYDEMLMLAKLIFPKLSKMEAVRTYGIHGPLHRFIELFMEIHQL